MTIKRLVISGRLNNLNDLISALSFNRYHGAGVKKKNENLIRSQFTPNQHSLEGVYYHFIFHEPNKRRDPDNIASSIKFIFDSFQELGFIKNDGWQQVRSIHHSFKNDTPDNTYYVEISNCETLEEYIFEITRMETDCN